MMSFLGILRHMNFMLAFAFAFAMPLNVNPIKMLRSFRLKWAGKKVNMHVVML